MNCLRKLFEEARSSNYKEINGDEIFYDVIRNMDRTVKKDDFIYAILNTKAFTLTRTEITNITSLLLNIVDKDER